MAPSHHGRTRQRPVVQLAPLRIRGGLLVELYRRLEKGTGEVPWAAGVWARAVPLPGVKGALCMDPLDTLLYTCKHLAVHHRFQTQNGRAGLADVRLLVQRYGFDAEELRARASEWGVGPGVEGRGPRGSARSRHLQVSAYRRPSAADSGYGETSGFAR